MAGPSPQPYYTPISKPTANAHVNPWKRSNLYSLALITILCSLSYLFGAWQHGGATTSFTTPSNLGATLSCVLPENTTTSTATTVSKTSSSKALDFSSHHSADDRGIEKVSDGSAKVYPPCDVKYSEYTPCEDPKRSLKFPRDRLIYRERHCPAKHELLKCRIPAPYGYKNRFKWPLSRDLAWYANVPHKELTVEKAVQNWIRYEGARFRFPGGGTMFPNGADAYIDDIGKLINLKDGSIRTAIDTGCGAKQIAKHKWGFVRKTEIVGRVKIEGSKGTTLLPGPAFLDLTLREGIRYHLSMHELSKTHGNDGIVASWGAYLLSRNILAMSFAPRDTHEAQVQFALERGVPALIGVLASKRLPYPSRAFDMAHCSRCLIPWGQYDGVFLTEVDRVLRPGGYWILSGPPIRWRKYWKGWLRTREDLNEEQTGIEKVAKSLCWKKLIEKDDIAIWQKPANHMQCKKLKKVHNSPAFCPNQDPDKAWYTNIETCLTPLPEVSDDQEIAGGQLEKWPKRLNAIPPRISTGTVNGITPQIFQKDSQLWKRRISYYKTVNNQLGQAGRYRNLLDMNAFLGGFAASLVKDPVWVMNVIPVEAKVNTLGVIYERGLIGTYQSWCEAVSTYPRTYDLVHADSIFSLYKDRCEMEDILLEMDRILRPEGSLIIRDDVDILVKAKRIADALNWDSQIVDHEDGPLEREKLLFAVKSYWTAPASSDQGDS